MKHAFNAPTRTHTWTFSRDVNDVRYVVTKYDVDPVDDAAMVHGFKQKIADAAAIPFAKNDRYATDQEKRDAMQAVVDRLNDGKWNAELGGGGKKPKLVNVEALVAAIVAIRGRAEAAVRAFVDAKTEEQRNALSMNDEFWLEYAMQCVRLAGPAKALDAGLTDELDALE